MMLLPLVVRNTFPIKMMVCKDWEKVLHRCMQFNV